MCDANFQCCLHTQYDQGFNPAVCANGEDWIERMRRMKHRLSVALELFLLPPLTEQLAKRQLQCVVRIAPEQSWSSIVGHWACTTGWQANFDSMPSHRRERPLIKWDDKLCNITNTFFPLHDGWLAAAKLPFWQNAWQFFVSHFVASRSSFSPCPYGIVGLMFYFDSGGRKAKKCLEQHRKLASYIVNLSNNGWWKHALAWTGRCRTRIGRPTNRWDVQIQMYCRC